MMSDELEVLPEGTVTSPRGFRAGAVHAGIRANVRKPDLGLLYSEVPCVAAAVYTSNRVRAAPILVTKRHLADGRAQAVVANSGCANAATGQQGQQDAWAMAQLAGVKLGLDPHDVVVASTGVIGTFLAMDKIRTGVDKIRLSVEGAGDFARAIMTTDTRPKYTAVRFAGYTLGGVAKGAGMIHPNMATMLSFLTTDAPVSQPFLVSALRQAVDASFNLIDVDGDTSTNDTVVVLANGLAGGTAIEEGQPAANALRSALSHVCISLARAIVADAEGTTRLIEATVTGAVSVTDARRAAREIVRSLAVKTAVYGGDPNWGRVLAAVGNSGCQIEEARATLWLSGSEGEEICLYCQGQPLPFDQEQARALLRNTEVRFRLDFALGEAAATAWGSDLTEDYVRLNSLYTT